MLCKNICKTCLDKHTNEQIEKYRNNLIEKSKGYKYLDALERWGWAISDRKTFVEKFDEQWESGIVCCKLFPEQLDIPITSEIPYSCPYALEHTLNQQDM